MFGDGGGFGGLGKTGDSLDSGVDSRFGLRNVSTGQNPKTLPEVQNPPRKLNPPNYKTLHLRYHPEAS